MQVLAWGLAALAAALVAWLVVRLVRASAAEKRARAAAATLGAVSDAGGVDDALARTPEDWHRSAQELAAGGRRRESLRALYLALLSAMHRAGVIRYDRTRTNTAYVRDVHPGHPARTPFEALTALFDVCWYGEREPSEDALSRAMDDAETVLRAFAAEAARA